MQEDFREHIKSLGRLLAVFGVLLVVVVAGIFYIKNNPDALKSSEIYQEVPLTETPTIELDAATIAESGFTDDIGVSQVIQNCTQCHSAKLVTQNRMSQEGWQATIIWMQETQNLWDLGTNHEKIITYLAKNYGPGRKGRRQNLTQVDWYALE